MKLGDIYNLVVEMGMKHDPRSKKDVNNALIANRKRYRSLKAGKKAQADADSFFNPYSDTRVLYGDSGREVKTIMAGIDMDVSELLLADRFGKTGERIDLVISHHPSGRALAELYKVMDIQTERLKALGVPRDVADDIMADRIGEVARKLHAANTMRSVDAARILDMPYMCAHTAADNMVNEFLQKFFGKKKPKTVGAAIDMLEAIPEYKRGMKAGSGPAILIGQRKNPSGRIFVDMTGGTEGSKRVFGRISQIGIGTIICMHLSEAHYKEAKKEHLNVIIAGHIASDSIGLNLMLDEIMKRERLNIIPCSGFIRFSRR